jgi:hypothetical protein
VNGAVAAPLVPLLSSGVLLAYLIGWGRPGTRLFLYVAIVCGVLLTAGIVLTLLFLATVE